MSFRIALIVILMLPIVSFGDHLRLVTGEWAPYTSENLPGKGFFSEIIMSIFDEMGHDTVTEFFPWNRCQYYIQKGHAFAAFPYAINEERTQFAFFSDPVFPSRSLFFYNNKQLTEPVTYNELTDLQPYRIAGVQGYFYEKELKKAELNVHYYQNELHALEMIRVGRADLIPINEPVGWTLIKKRFPNQTNEFSTLPKPFSYSPLRLMISRKHPQARKLVMEFNLALAKFKLNGNIQKILQLRGIPDPEIQPNEE